MRKAQVTLFIIIGAVILISTLFFFVFKSKITDSEVVQNLIVQEVPSDYLPIQPFVERCLEQTAIEGLEILGQRGGYIYEDGLNPRNSVRLSGMIIPHWLAMTSDEDCTSCEFSTAKLPLRGSTSVEKQLSRYIDENLQGCTAGFEGIRELGFDVEEKKPTSTVTVAESDVAVQLRYPLSVSKQGSSVDFESFYIILPVNLNRIYEMATYIADNEQQYRYIERAVLNMIVAFSGRSVEKLPPMSESDFSRKTVQWRKTQVKNDVRDILSGYIPLLRVQNTYNYRDVDTGSYFTDRLYNYGMVIPHEGVSTLGVGFTYLDITPLYFDLNCNGESCRPESAFTDLIPIGLQRYNFAYDLSFPVLVEIDDPEAFNEQGYTFTFMLEANIRNNRPLQASFIPFGNADTGTSLFCDESIRTSKNVKISFKDSMTGASLDDVEVAYSCVESCIIGQSQSGMLESTLPLCTGGELSFIKEGYASKSIPYDANTFRDDSFTIELDPKIEMTVEVRKKPFRKQGGDWFMINDEMDIDAEDTVSILASKADGTDSALLEIRQGATDIIAVSKGMYSFDVNILSESHIVIPPSTMEGMEIDGYESDYFVSGSTVFAYEFTEADMAKKNIVIIVGARDILNVPEDERKVTDLEVANYGELRTE